MYQLDKSVDNIPGNMVKNKSHSIMSVYSRSNESQLNLEVHSIKKCFRIKKDLIIKMGILPPFVKANTQLRQTAIAYNLPEYMYINMFRTLSFKYDLPTNIYGPFVNGLQKY